MAHLPVFMTPQTTPGRMTLQADRATWEALLQHIPGDYRGIPPLIRAALDADPDAATVRIMMNDASARAILRLAGVSS